MAMAYRANNPTGVTGEVGSEPINPDDQELVDCIRTRENRCYDLFVRRFGPRVLAVAIPRSLWQ